MTLCHVIGQEFASLFRALLAQACARPVRLRGSSPSLRFISPDRFHCPVVRKYIFFPYPCRCSNVSLCVYEEGSQAAFIQRHNGAAASCPQSNSSGFHPAVFSSNLSPPLCLSLSGCALFQGPLRPGRDNHGGHGARDEYQPNSDGHQRSKPPARDFEQGRPSHRRDERSREIFAGGRCRGQRVLGNTRVANTMTLIVYTTIVVDYGRVVTRYQ